MVNITELRNFLPKEGNFKELHHSLHPSLEAEALLQAADNNDDGELTFAELASSVFVSHVFLVLTS